MDAKMINKTVNMGHDLTDKFREACEKYTEEKKTDYVPIGVIQLYVASFVSADRKLSKKFKGKKRAAVEHMAKWKENILQNCMKSYHKYSEQHQTKNIPLHIIKGIIVLVDEQIAS